MGGVDEQIPWPPHSQQQAPSNGLSCQLCVCLSLVAQMHKAPDTAKIQEVWFPGTQACQGSHKQTDGDDVEQGLLTRLLFGLLYLQDTHKLSVGGHLAQ